MATVKKSKKKVIIPIVCAVLVVAIIVGVVFGVANAKKGKSVSLYTIGTDNISESVSLTGTVIAGASKEYKVGTVATVKEVFVKVGDKVKEGDVLATFDITELNAQIASLQESYNDTLKSYNAAIKSQKAAKDKADALAKEIKALEKEVARLQATVDANATSTTTTTTQPSTKPTTQPSTKPTVPSSSDNDNEADSSTSTTVSTTRRPSTGDPLLDFQLAIDDLNETLSKLSDDVTVLTQTTQIIASTITELAGKIDNDAIANKIVENLVASGIAENVAKQIVESIDVGALVNAALENDNAQLTTAQIQLLALQGQYAIASAQADTTMTDMQKKSLKTTKQALTILQAQKKEMEQGWKASFDGTITAVDIEPYGQTTLISSGITLENLDSVAVKLSLSEYDLQKVAVGMKSKVTTAFGEYDGEIISIAPTATGGSSSGLLDNVGSMAGISGLSSLTDSGAGVECIVSVPDADKNIIVGFNANVEIQIGEHNDIVVVPIESIKLEKAGSFVYLYNEEEGTVTKTQITTGANSISAYEVLEGLKVGDRIVAAPESNYEEETFKVTIKN